MFKHKTVEEVGIGIPQIAQVDVFLDRGSLRCQLLHASLTLKCMTLDTWRSQAVNSEFLPNID